MSDDIYAAVGRRYGFDEWRDKVRLPQRLFVREYRVREDVMPGWELRKATQLRAPAGHEAEPSLSYSRTAGPAGRPDADMAAAWPVLLGPQSSPSGPEPTRTESAPTVHTRSFWQAEDSEDILVEAEIYECPSVVAAHDWLLRLLSAFQSPVVERKPDGEVGDICFGGPVPTALLFARANLVVSVRNAGRELVDVTAIARNIDSDLIAKPPRGREARMRASVKRAAMRKAPLGSQVPLLSMPVLRSLARLPEGASDSAASDAPASLPPCKIFYDEGEIEAAGDQLHFRADEPGVHRFEIYGLGAGDDLAVSEVRVDVAPSEG